MYNLIEYSDNHSKTSGVLCQFCADVPSIDANGDITDFTEVNATDSFNCKEELTSQTENVEIMVLIKYVSTFWRTLEMPLIKLLNWMQACNSTMCSFALKIWQKKTKVKNLDWKI